MQIQGCPCMRKMHIDVVTVSVPFRLSSFGFWLASPTFEKTFRVELGHNRMWALSIVLLAATCFQAASQTAENIQYSAATCRNNNSLSRSSWPSDHGDSSRTKFTVGAGLPKGKLDAEQLKVVEQNELPGAQWIYTYGDNNEYTFVMGGTIVSTYVAKLDSKTLNILQKVYLKPAMYIGGLLMHGNGHVYGVQGNTLTVFWNGDLTNKTVTDLPLTGNLNGNAVQTNGMVVSSDGYLVIKQWSFILEDLALYLYVMPVVVKVIIGGMLLVGLLVVYLIPKKLKNPFTITGGLFLGSGLGLALFVGLFLVVQWKLFGYSDPFKFVSTNLFVENYGGGGQLKFIDPITLEVVADLSLVERCSFGRMSLSALENSDKEDAIVLIGDEFIRQYRWNPVQKRLYEIEEWAERYRSRNAGTFPGTGPATYNGVTYFTDNTFPVMLFEPTYNLFSKRLEPESSVEGSVSGGGSEGSGVVTSGGGDVKSVAAPMQRVAINQPGMSGYMFWSVVVSPVEGDVIVWDSAGRSVQARRAHDLSLKWNISAVQGDCITVAADKGHVYMTDYSTGPADYSSWMAAIGPNGKKMFPHIEKYFVVADARNGEILLNTTILAGEGMRPALIVPGGHNDVLVGKPTGLNRMYINLDTL